MLFKMYWLPVNFEICSVTFTLVSEFKLIMTDVWSVEFDVKVVLH